ncbi:MAG: hypothetical protein QM809_05590 [Gordonia sp. (in: high G+C Gram-positive bacteria)]|uniref:hypothetical protein n=1 Tax=Gordonia sp. (in: high G+C Gram-positive bacteria) TaxID=84139 RepID=UPI0039E39FF8
MTAPRRERAVLLGTSALLTAAICAPLWGGGLLLHRDAVATPRAPLTAAAFGIDGAPPRAVPQDGALALASQVVDGGVLLAALTTAALFCAGVGYGRLARRLLPWTGSAGAVAAAGVAIWNPWVAERLLQGHWSLLIGYAALGWITIAVLDLRRRPGWAGWAVLGGLFAAAGFTPTGSVSALVVALTAALSFRRDPNSEPSSRLLPGVLALWLFSALPWLVATAFSDGAVSGVGGAREFAARAEPGLGTFGSVLGLGGIWNADAVPASRGFWWAAAATACLVAVVAGGVVVLRRHRGDLPPAVPALAVLAGVAVLSVAAAAVGPGPAVVDLLLTHVPGAGLLRDTQKFVALAVPFVALAVAAAAGWLREWVPTGFVVAVLALLIVAPLPDLAWGVGGELQPVEYPSDYAAAVALIGHDTGAVAVVPADTMRVYPWNRGPSLSPLPRMLDAPVIVGSTLLVDGEPIDAPTDRDRRVSAVLERGGDPGALAVLGVGWVVVERTTGASAAPRALDANPRAERVHDGDDLVVYRIGDPVAVPGPGAGAWLATGTAHGLWLVLLLAGLVAQLARVTVRRTSANSSAVPGQE